MTCNKYKNVPSDTRFNTQPMSGSVEFLTRILQLFFAPKKYRLSMSSAHNKGRRDYQEDMVLTGTKAKSRLSVCVLADGMGGHHDGGTASDIASRAVMRKLLAELTMDHSAKDIHDLLFNCAHEANKKIAQHIKENAIQAEMGTTLVAIAIRERKLHWVSIGDSPLYLFRNGTLTQINEDHSMAPQIDELVQMGIITKDSAENHLDRNRLTSALMGHEINRIDLPDMPIDLFPKDILVISSDGLQFLPDAKIETILKQNANASAAAITKALMNNVLALNDPGQDNIGICSIRYRQTKGDPDECKT